MGCSIAQKSDSVLSRDIAPIEPLKKSEKSSYFHQTIESLSSFAVFNYSNFCNIKKTQLVMQRCETVGCSFVREPSDEVSGSAVERRATAAPEADGDAEFDAELWEVIKAAEDTIRKPRENPQQRYWDFSNQISW